MNKKLEAWCYGGKSKAFFIEENEAIHQYNTKMMDRLLWIMTIILGCYVAIEVCTEPTLHYLIAYGVCFAMVLIMLCLFKLKTQKSILFTRIYIVLLSSVMFGFVSVLGTIFEPNSRAIMFIVYLIALPMLFISPTHYTYGFLTIANCIFSIMSILIKDWEYARMDIMHGITGLVLGIFISHHILESRMALYALNRELDTDNFQLDKQLQEKEIQLLQGRIAILLSQIQPHFLYNALTAICGLCDENPKEAKRVTAEFADYLRHNLESLTQYVSVPFIDELKHTKVYLGIEMKRFEERLNIIYDIATMDFLIPSLTVQPIVENAVKHGVIKRENGGIVTIATRAQENCYEIIISDDGVGFNTMKSLSEPDTHIGIKNVRDRLWSMCKGTLTIKSEIGIGTTAIIRIPKENTATEMTMVTAEK